MLPALLFSLIAALAAPAPLNLPDPAKLGPKNIAVPESGFTGLYFVSIAAGNDETGTGTKKTPWQSVPYALRQIDGASADSPSAVFVAAGVYNHGTITMVDGMSLFGGFDPETWERDIVANATVLSGGGVRRVLVGANDCRIDGFVITKGNSHGHGGGILCEDTSPHISNNVFTGNTTMEPPYYDPLRIHQHGYEGGAIACRFSAYPVIENNLIYGNKTGVGGGAGVSFHGWIRPITLPNAQLRHNILVSNASGTADVGRTRSSNGGAVACSYEASPLIEENLIVGNHGGGRGDAGGIYCEYQACPQIQRNWIVGNSCEDDGAAFYAMRVSEPVIESNLFAGNGGGGSVLRVSKEGRAIIKGNAIVHNQAGNAVQLVDGHLILENNLIADNRLGAGIGIAQRFDYYKPSLFAGNVITGNEGGVLDINEATEAHYLMRDCVTEGDTDAALVSTIEVQAAYQHSDAVRHVFKVAGKTPAPGVAVSVNEVWGVIASSDGDLVTVIARLDAGFEANTAYTMNAVILGSK